MDDIWVIRDKTAMAMLTDEIEQAMPSGNVLVTRAQLRAIQETLVNILVSYFKNDPASFLTEFAKRGASIDAARRAVLRDALVKQGLFNESQAHNKSDAELLEALWRLGAPNTPFWWGLAVGKSQAVIFRASTDGEIEAQSLRQALLTQGGTTWKPVGDSRDTPAITVEKPALFTEILLWVGQYDDHGFSVLPYIMRFRYDETKAVWTPVLMWTPESSAARLVF